MIIGFVWYWVCLCVSVICCCNGVVLLFCIFVG